MRRSSRERTPIRPASRSARRSRPPSRSCAGAWQRSQGSPASPSWTGFRARAAPQSDIELSDDSTVTAQSARVASADPRPPLREATVAGIEPSYFDVLEAPILAGRAFNAADLAPGASVAIVDQGFVDQVLQGRNPIGQQVRFVQDGDDAAAKAPIPGSRSSVS